MQFKRARVDGWFFLMSMFSSGESHKQIQREVDHVKNCYLLEADMQMCYIGEKGGWKQCLLRLLFQSSTINNYIRIVFHAYSLSSCRTLTALLTYSHFQRRLPPLEFQLVSNNCLPLYYFIEREVKERKRYFGGIFFC